jgi:hypothetical protein
MHYAECTMHHHHARCTITLDVAPCANYCLKSMENAPGSTWANSLSFVKKMHVKSM